MAMVFSTQDVHPRERLSYWRETAGAQDVDLSASPGFLATLRNQTLDNVTVSELDCDPCRVRRTERNIARAGCDHFVLFMQQGGRGWHLKVTGWPSTKMADSSSSIRGAPTN